MPKEKTCTRCQISKPLFEFYKASREKDGLTYHCKQCLKKYEEKRPDRRAYHREHHNKNRADRNEQNKKWLKENAEKRRAYKLQYRRTHAEQIKDYCKKYRKINAGKINASNASREKKIKVATPPWANLKKIERIYMLAAWASKFTKTSLHVDHIIPIDGREICGLHVENNLQILPAAENIRKFNHFRESI